jgi:hypothetical protein
MKQMAVVIKNFKWEIRTSSMIFTMCSYLLDHIHIKSRKVLRMMALLIKAASKISNYIIFYRDENKRPEGIEKIKREIFIGKVSLNS